MYGRVSYKDDSACGNCCSAQTELSGGPFSAMSKSVCADGYGDFRIDLAYYKAKRVFFKGNTDQHLSKD